MSIGERENDAARREKAEPTEGMRPVPWLFVGIIACLTAWGGFTLYHGSGVEPDQSAASGNLPQVIDGGVLYTAHCAACHQTDGKGVAGAFPPLAGSEWVDGKPDMLARILLLGIDGSIGVKGNQYNGSMPAFGGTLSDAELVAVANHIRTSFGNNAKPPLDTQMLKRVRERLKDRTKSWSGGAELGRTE
ncbi:cytochrome Cbb3 [Burkholderia pyrrocinia]|uniref:c-type cytochrome n=1 Tax=Burkholderia pyrrocinia TaxID=60550 RepID=UPI00050004FF|nr:cytochrome c [Burkholderia pyrrocinia]KFL49729.1 cytochrome Cbb3 [Burkholderia pyrrocinia]